MTAPDPRVGEIEARLSALTPSPRGQRLFDASDVSYLLAELRKAHEALARVEGVADEFDRESEASDNVAAEVMKAPRTNAVREELSRHEQHAVIAHNHAARIRAAVAAANGDGNG